MCPHAWTMSACTHTHKTGYTAVEDTRSHTHTLTGITGCERSLSRGRNESDKIDKFICAAMNIWMDGTKLWVCARDGKRMNSKQRHTPKTKKIPANGNKLSAFPMTPSRSLLRNISRIATQSIDILDLLAKHFFLSLPRSSICGAVIPIFSYPFENEKRQF